MEHPQVYSFCRNCCLSTVLALLTMALLSLWSGLDRRNTGKIRKPSTRTAGPGTFKIPPLKVGRDCVPTASLACTQMSRSLFALHRSCEARVSHRGELPRHQILHSFPSEVGHENASATSSRCWRCVQSLAVQCHAQTGSSNMLPLLVRPR